VSLAPQAIVYFDRYSIFRRLKLVRAWPYIELLFWEVPQFASLRASLLRIFKVSCLVVPPFELYLPAKQMIYCSRTNIYLNAAISRRCLI